MIYLNVMDTDDKSDEKKVLLVEDDQTIRELYAVALVNADLDIIMAENGEQGLEMALKYKPSLILLQNS